MINLLNFKEKFCLFLLILCSLSALHCSYFQTVPFAVNLINCSLNLSATDVLEGENIFWSFVAIHYKVNANQHTQDCL